MSLVPRRTPAAELMKKLSKMYDLPLPVWKSVPKCVKKVVARMHLETMCENCIGLAQTFGKITHCSPGAFSRSLFLHFLVHFFKQAMHTVFAKSISYIFQSGGQLF